MLEGGIGGGEGESLYLLTILLIVSGSFNDPDMSGNLNNPRNDVMD